MGLVPEGERLITSAPRGTIRLESMAPESVALLFAVSRVTTDGKADIAVVVEEAARIGLSDERVQLLKGTIDPRPSRMQRP